tara:strand:- start:362 stop:706 length:345 start_codon:yes stop_codon:yes gene_type:complete
MRKLTTTIVLTIISIVSFSQMRVIDTDSVQVGTDVKYKQYRFFVSKGKSVAFGTSEEETGDYTYIVPTVKYNTIEVNGNIYDCYLDNNMNVYVNQSKKEVILKIKSEDITIIFY